MVKSRTREPLQLVAWDYDGTLVDTCTPYWEAWTREFGQHGLTIPLDLWSAMMRTNADPAQVLRENFGVDVPKTRVQQINGSVLDSIRRDGYMPGARALLDQCLEQNLVLVLVTNGSEEWLRATMPEGMRQSFHFIQTGAEKPNSRAYEAVLQRTGVHPLNAVGIEDTPWGVTALRGAGITSLFVPSQPYRELHIPGVARRDSLQGVTPDLLSLARPLPAASMEMEFK